MHHLVQELKEDGVIESAIFAIYLTNTDEQSKIHFGGYDQSIVSTLT